MSIPHFGLLLFKWRQDDFYKLANNVHLFFSGLFTFPTQHIITISSLFCLSLVTNSSPFTFTSPYSLVTSNLSPTPVFTPGVTVWQGPTQVTPRTAQGRVSPLLLTNSAHLGPISGLGLIVRFSRSSLTNFNIATNLAMARVQLLFHSTVLLESAFIFSGLWWQERVAF